MTYDRKTKRQAAIGFLICAPLTVAVVFLSPWKPHADFDVTGVLWLMQNILPLFLFSIFFALASGAAIVWLRCKTRKLRD